MRLEGYERRYGAGVRSVYKPGMQQTDMVEDLNREIRLEIEVILPAHPSLRRVSGVVVDVGDTSYGLGTLGRRYIDVVCRFGPATRDFTTHRRYCPGPSLVKLTGIQGLTDGVIGELLRIRHGLKNQGQDLVIRPDEIDTGPPAQYPPYIAPQIRQYPKGGCNFGPTSLSSLTGPLSSPSKSILSGGQTLLSCAPKDKFNTAGSQLEELTVTRSAGGGSSSDSRRDAQVPAITGKIMLEVRNSIP
ncbi:hypothetical protein VKT23_009899 [Stygiomarasmius scandens]|uniref:Uncharacterized protein n=1 Tax=Marasmiellus scandens TaxID=2682957 RepID=A0ABR1JDL0_9AGAR